mmetsp:Transcript_45974/g.104761  ORF Transcript_45974/g.104761 Transcript_45974/m.104761 type:complete len:256 (-) Transcript_45974:5-772(-)
MLQKPKMASTRLPGIMALTVALSSPIFLPMISEPASPKPSASSLPSLMMAFSRIFVSRVCTLVALRCRRRQAPHESMQRFHLPFSPGADAISSSCACASLYVSSPSLMAKSGLSRILSTLLIIRSIGCSTSTFASWLKASAPISRMTQTKSVWSMLNTAAFLAHGRRSNTKIRSGSLFSSMSMGEMVVLSESRRPSGQASPGSSIREVYRHELRLSSHARACPPSSFACTPSPRRPPSGAPPKRSLQCSAMGLYA